MKVLLDIGHPAHVHFFYQPLRKLLEHGHEVLITSRDKEFALDLLSELGLEHIPISSQHGKGIIPLGIELIKRNSALFRIVKQHRPTVMAGIGGVFIAQVGKLTGVPSLVFYDTENARLQNALTYPFASCVIAPRCYSSWLPKGRHIKYRGYHELSYLHPNYFRPDKKRALENGLAATGDTFLLRLVSWQASHDIGEGGWTTAILKRIVEKLSLLGKVIISSEGALGSEFEPYRYPGKVSEIHHVMAFCRAYIGESATMASECAVLGVPAVYAATTGRGYTDEQERLYDLVKNIRTLDWKYLEPAIDELLTQPPAHRQDQRQALLADTIDVAAFVTECIETFPAPLKTYNHTADS